MQLFGECLYVRREYQVFVFITKAVTNLAVFGRLAVNIKDVHDDFIYGIATNLLFTAEQQFATFTDVKTATAEANINQHDAVILANVAFANVFQHARKGESIHIYLRFAKAFWQVVQQCGFFVRDITPHDDCQTGSFFVGYFVEIKIDLIHAERYGIVQFEFDGTFQFVTTQGGIYVDFAHDDVAGIDVQHDLSVIYFLFFQGGSDDFAQGDAIALLANFRRNHFVSEVVCRKGFA